MIYAHKSIVAIHYVQLIVQYLQRLQEIIRPSHYLTLCSENGNFLHSKLDVLYSVHVCQVNIYHSTSLLFSGCQPITHCMLECNLSGSSTIPHQKNTNKPCQRQTTAFVEPVFRDDTCRDETNLLEGSHNSVKGFSRPSLIPHTRCSCNHLSIETSSTSPHSSPVSTDTQSPAGSRPVRKAGRGHGVNHIMCIINSFPRQPCLQVSTGACLCAAWLNIVWSYPGQTLSHMLLVIFSQTNK